MSEKRSYDKTTMSDVELLMKLERIRGEFEQVRKEIIKRVKGDKTND